jgi:hypothetical protein
VILVTVPVITLGVDDLMAYRRLNAHPGTAAVIGVPDVMVSLVVPGIHTKLYLGTGKGSNDHPCNQQPCGNYLIAFHRFSPSFFLCSHFCEFVSQYSIRRPPQDLTGSRYDSLRRLLIRFTRKTTSEMASRM